MREPATAALMRPTMSVITTHCNASITSTTVTETTWCFGGQLKVRAWVKDFSDNGRSYTV